MSTTKRLCLIDNAGQAWRMWSVLLSAALALLSAVQAELLPIVQPLVPADKWPWVSGAMALGIIVARVLKQQLDAPAPLPLDAEEPRP